MNAISKYEPLLCKSVIIVGAQGCGKTILARMLAEPYGSFVETDATQLSTHRGLYEAMAGEPSTIICDGVPNGEDANAQLKAMLAGGTMVIRHAHGPVKAVRAPRLIFCINDCESIPSYISDRRFYIIRLANSAR